MRKYLGAGLMALSLAMCFNSEAGELPPAFGAALQASTYSGVGPVYRAFPDGAREAQRLGVKALKISMSREALVTPTFYHLAQLQGVSDSQLQNSVQSLTEMAKLKAYDYVLSLPFETIFIQTTEIGLADQSSHYWNISTVPLSEVSLQNIYRQHYDLAIHLLNRYRGTGRTFVLFDHEADWHASIWNGSGYSDNTDIGHANYLKYWPIRQKAVNDARRAVASDVKIYNMCEVVRVGTSVTSGAKSLTRDVLSQVTCDLVGYSAHDTALIADGGQTLRQAVDYIRARARPSPIFGQNQVIISEIAVPELIGYLPRKDQVVQAIDQYLRQGMPWIIYWQFYDNEGVGNYLVKPNNDFSETFYSLLAKLGIDPRQLAGRVSSQPSFVIGNAPAPQPAPTPNPTPTPTPTPPPATAACKDMQRVPATWNSTAISGVSASVSKMYYELLGGVGSYVNGARHITSLNAQGYSLQSLRLDVINDPAVRTELNKVYQYYLGRPVTKVDYARVKTYYQTPGNSLRGLELQILNSAECKQRKAAGLAQ